MPFPFHYAVRVDRNLDEALVYGAMQSEIPKGALVRVPLGHTRGYGIVLGRAMPDPSLHLREIEAVLDHPPLRQDLLTFIDKMADYTLTRRGMIVRTLLSGLKTEHRPKLDHLARGDAEPKRMTPERRKVIDACSHAGPMTKAQLVSSCGVGRGVVEGLVRQGALKRVAAPDREELSIGTSVLDIRLNAHQSAAFETINSRLKAGFSTTLLHGVTGSGKTEVYFALIAEVLRAGAQALLMLPEIALTRRIQERFAQRFGVQALIWHSAVSGPKRAFIMREVLSGKPLVVLGARSALFLPFSSLGLVIVDEEHDGAYKSETQVIHHARDMAILRASCEKVPVLLGSATPALETWRNVMIGRYEKLVLPERHNRQAMPDIRLIDLTQDAPPPGRYLSSALTSASENHLANGDQVLLFVNRRGYAPLTLCRACGHRFACPSCSAWLVEHRLGGRDLRCHHCGHKKRRPKLCPSCEKDALIAYGPGIERLAEEAAGLFPSARLLSLSSDLSDTAVQRGLRAIESGDVSLIVGTQMIAKGHDFSRIKLVGIVDADMSMARPDLRSFEHGFQLLNQVMGRAGRTGKPGVGLVQTHMPSHPMMQALAKGDQETFYQRELDERERLGWPPATRLCAVIVSARAKQPPFETALHLARLLDGPLTILGPVEAPLFRLKNHYRYRLLLRSERRFDLPSFVRGRLADFTPTGGVSIRIDMDPFRLL